MGDVPPIGLEKYAFSHTSVEKMRIAGNRAQTYADQMDPLLPWLGFHVMAILTTGAITLGRKYLCVLFSLAGYVSVMR